MKYAIKTENIYKNYNKINALKDINIEVNNGEIFGLIGPDGAGKTSLIRILTTLILPDKGKALLMGNDVVKKYKKIRKIIGYMPGKFSLYQDLTVEENIDLFSGIFGTSLKENYYLVKDIYSQIEPFKKRKAGALSGGMKQKLALSCALIHKPEVLFLDEPTTGVDAVSRKEFWEMLRKLKQYGITILVSTPYMDEARLCDRVALIQKGNILKIAPPEEIVNQFGKQLIAINAKDKYKLLNNLRNYEKANSVFLFGEYIHYTEKDNNPDLNKLEQFLKVNNHKEIEIKIIKPNIEDCFMELMVDENE